MRGRRLAQIAGTAAALAGCLLLPASGSGFNGTVLRGFGTATIDGVIGAGEWDAAGRANFTVQRATSPDAPATLYVMNDSTNLYVGIQVQNATVGSSTAEILFDNDHDDNTREEGEDDIYVDGSGFVYDGFVHQVSPNNWQIVDDTDYGGAHDVDEADADGPGYSFYEFSHRLDSADNAHDFSVRAPMRIGFLLRFRHCAPACGPTSYYPPARTNSEILIVSGSRVAPDTQITSGPQEGALLAETSTTFEFTGSDDVVSPSELTFECKDDEGDWRPCTAPHEFGGDDGRHTFSVRAVDEMLNVDQSPAQRTWTVDWTGPSKPAIRGLRSLRHGKRLVLRFSARDEIAGGVRFKCAVDSWRLKGCPAVFRVKLRPGRHIVRVRALDRLGNQSELSTFRVRIKRARR